MDLDLVFGEHVSVLEVPDVFEHGFWLFGAVHSTA